MIKGYFVVTMKNGDRNDFGKKCDKVSEFSTSGRMICFQQTISSGFITLAIINVDDIESIDRHEIFFI